MALPAELLAQLPSSVFTGGAAFPDPGFSAQASILPGSAEALTQAAAGQPSELFGRSAARALRLGLPLDALLPDGGLPSGAVVEMSVSGAAALGTSVALAACRAAQAAGADTEEKAWCAFVDPTGSLYAPAAARAGVSLERLLVLRPSLEALSRTALRLVESQVFPLVVVDLAGIAGKLLDVPLAGWVRVVRRLAIAVEHTDTTVLLITDSAAARPLPLPVAQRFELRLQGELLSVRTTKDRRGRVMGTRKVRASAMRAGSSEDREASDGSERLSA